MVYWNSGIKKFSCCIIIFFGGMFFWRCGGREKETISTVREDKEYPSQEGWNSELYLSKAGRLQAIVQYGHMTKYEKKKIILFDEGIVVDFFDEEGEHTSKLTSMKGEYFETTEDVVGKGNVVVVSDSGVTLRTEILKWDNHLGKILSDTSVMVTTHDKDTLYGVGFESDPDLSHWIIREPWGISEKWVDIEKMEDSFSKGFSGDTIKEIDSVKSE